MTSWQPLTIWFYEECYVRFAAEDYEYHKVGNKFSYLTNNSIAKYSKKEKVKKIEGNMWDVNQFNDYLKVSVRNFGPYGVIGDHRERHVL